MPTIESAITLNVSLTTAASPSRNWGIGVIVGEKEIATAGAEGAYETTVSYNGSTYPLVDANTPTVCYNPSDAYKYFGNPVSSTDPTGSTITRAAIDMFNQGVRKIYCLALTATTIGTPTASEYTSALANLTYLANDKLINGVVLAGAPGYDCIAALKTYCDTNELLFAATNTNPGTETASQLVSSFSTILSKRGVSAVHNDANAECDIGACLLGMVMAQAPWNTIMWKLIDCDVTEYFTPSDIETLEAGNLNAIHLIYDTNRLADGLSLAGSSNTNYKFLDIYRTEQYVTTTIRDALVTLRTNAQKIPFTQAGINVIAGALISAMESTARAGAIAEYEVIMPTYSQTSESDRANRILSNISINARLAGDVHKFTIGLNITV